MMQHRRLTEQLLGSPRKDLLPLNIESMKEGISGKSRGGKLACSSMKWTTALFITNLLWFSLLIFQTSKSASSCFQSLSLGRHSSWLRRSKTCAKLHVRDEQWAGDLREFEGAWNRLCFGPIKARLKIACFVKKWPIGGAPGGMERHAMTLYRDLASRGHEVHVFTVNANGENVTEHVDNNLHIHFLPVVTGIYSDEVWDKYFMVNLSTPFDVVHSESRALPPKNAKQIPIMAATWHGVAAEAIHSDIAMDRIRKPGEARSEELQQNIFGRINEVIEETRFFHDYGNHVAISDYAADILRTVYELPLTRVHTIFNGVDSNFQPDAAKGIAFREKYGIPQSAKLVFGAAGRLVKDKGHPMLFEAFTEIVKRHPDVYLLVAGSGPWADRYKNLAPNVISLGPMPPVVLIDFYNAVDIFVDPTLRSQGLDTTLLEAMQCGKPLLATMFSSITWTIIINQEFGYTFAPNVGALIAALEFAIQGGREKLEAHANTRYEYAMLMFAAHKMGSAYERLFFVLEE